MIRLVCVWTALSDQTLLQSHSCRHIVWKDINSRVQAPVSHEITETSSLCYKLPLLLHKLIICLSTCDIPDDCMAACALQFCPDVTNSAIASQLAKKTSYVDPDLNRWASLVSRYSPSERGALGHCRQKRKCRPGGGGWAMEGAVFVGKEGPDLRRHSVGATARHVVSNGPGTLSLDDFRMLAPNVEVLFQNLCALQNHAISTSSSCWSHRHSQGSSRPCFEPTAGELLLIKPTL